MILMAASYLVGVTVGEAATREKDDEEDDLPVVLTDRKIGMEHTHGGDS